MDIKNVLEIINEVVLLPITIITFLLLIYVVFYLSKKDPDVVRSKIFLKNYSIISDVQRFFGLLLSIIMISFVYVLIKSIK